MASAKRGRNEMGDDQQNEGIGCQGNAFGKQILAPEGSWYNMARLWRPASGMK